MVCTATYCSTSQNVGRTHGIGRSCLGVAHKPLPPRATFFTFRPACRADCVAMWAEFRYLLLWILAYEQALLLSPN